MTRSVICRMVGWSDGAFSVIIAPKKPCRRKLNLFQENTCTPIQVKVSKVKKKLQKELFNASNRF